MTFDKDFGELAGRSGLADGYGVLLLRIPMRRSAHIATEIADALAVRTDWVGHFSVLEPGRVRMRRLAT